MFNKYAHIANMYTLLKAARYMYRVKEAAGMRIPKIGPRTLAVDTGANPTAGIGRDVASRRTTRRATAPRITPEQRIADNIAYLKSMGYTHGLGKAKGLDQITLNELKKNVDSIAANLGLKFSPKGYARRQGFSLSDAFLLDNIRKARGISRKKFDPTTIWAGLSPAEFRDKAVYLKKYYNGELPDGRVIRRPPRTSRRSTPVVNPDGSITAPDAPLSDATVGQSIDWQKYLPYLYAGGLGVGSAGILSLLASSRGDD